MTEFTREPCKVIHLTSEDKALIEDLEALAEVRGKPRDHYIQINAVSYVAPEDARRIGITPDDQALLREHNAQRSCHEEQLEIRRQKEDKAFADALRRYTEMQQRTIWQRITALFGRES
jgi:hypothetical protein